MVRDVSTRWNSTSELIQRGLELREALKFVVVMQEQNRLRSARLRRFQLSADEWNLLQELWPLLDASYLSPYLISAPVDFPTGFPGCDKEDLPKPNTTNS
jgi:hypothetical protein